MTAPRLVRVHASLLALTATLACLGAGCASSAPAPNAEAPAAPPAASSPPSSGSEVAAADVSAEALQGSWVEFWALAGKADTQRYTFLADGRFGWTAAPQQSAGGGPARRFGRYSVQGEDQRADCDGSSACRAQHEPALEQRLSIGACPHNEEASALDGDYRCTSFDGQAFWRSATLSADGLAELAH